MIVPNRTVQFFVEALYAFNGTDTASLSFRKGDIIEVLTQLSSGWWDGVIWRQRERGWFPSNYVRRITDEEAQVARARIDAVTQLPSEKSTHGAAPSHVSRLSSTSSMWDGRGLINGPTPDHANPEINSQGEEILTMEPHIAVDKDPVEPSGIAQQRTHRGTLDTTSDQSPAPVPPSSWVDWLPRVNDDGQIYYYNTMSGQVAFEMPSADKDFELDNYSSHFRHARHDTKSTLASTALSAVTNDEDPLKFLEEHGFGLDLLIQHGIVSTSMDRFTWPVGARDTWFATPSIYQNGALMPSPIINDHRRTRSKHTLHAAMSSSPLMKSIDLVPSSRSGNQKLENSSPAPVPSHLSGLNTNGCDSDAEKTSIVEPNFRHGNRRSRSKSHSTPDVFPSAQLSQLSSLEDVNTASEQIINQLRASLVVPPTTTFSRMAVEVQDVISFLTKLTAPLQENIDPLHSAYGESLMNLLDDNVRDDLARASTDLVDKIRNLLQASCQLDSAVLSIPHQSSSAASFASLSFTLPHSCSTSLTSPHVNSYDGSFLTTLHNRSGSCPLSNLPTSSQLYYPDLKHVTRKIASTLSKLTLSTRALWGLLSTSVPECRSSSVSEPPGDCNSASATKPLDSFKSLGPDTPKSADFGKLQSSSKYGEDSEPQDIARSADGNEVQYVKSEVPETPPPAEVERRNLQTRFALEQKLRSECKMGVSDLSSNIDTFFYHFETLLCQNFAQTNEASRLATQFPRHARGHLTMPIESVFSPGGTVGGNWRGSGFDKVSCSSPEAYSNNPTSLTGRISCLTSAKSQYPPSTKLDLEWYSQRVLPLTRQAIGICGTINAIWSHEKMDSQADSDNVPTDPRSLLDTSRHVPENMMTQVLELVFELLEVSGNLLADSEDLDISFSLETDFDQLLWLGVYQNFGFKTPAILADDNPDAFLQLKFTRRLVEAFETAKQNVYEIMSELVHITQVLLTPGGNLEVQFVESPAQPPSASPLFTPNHPNREAPSVELLLDMLDRAVIYFKTFAEVTLSLAQEIEGQVTQDSKPAPITATVKNVIRRRVSLLGRDAQVESLPHLPLKFHKSVPSQGINDLVQASPRPHRLSRGIEEEQAELDTSGKDSGKRTSVTAASVWSNRTSSSIKSDKSIDHLPLPQIAGQNREPPPATSDTDRTETGSSRSPTRSKKLAKFFGEEAATQVMPAPKTPTAKPAFLLPDYGADDISFNADGQVRGGTLRGLVIKLTSHEGPDVPFLRVFLMTYRTFTTSHDFLDLLIERYQQAPPPDLSPEDLKTWTDHKQKVIKIRVINVMRSWIESYLSDEDAEGILKRVTEFSASDMGDTSLTKQVALTCERRQSRGALVKMSPVNPTGNPPPPMMPRNLRKLKLLDIEPLELARQLTLVESRLFCRIQVNECLGKAWPKEFAKEGTPNIKAMIDMSNALTRWVAETVLLQSEQKKRASTIKHFISVADRCRSLNNFSTLMQIIAGLNSTPIFRLRRTWETIPQKTSALFRQLGGVMSPSKNYAAYRDTIRNMAPPCVPFVGVYLTDWTFIGDGNPDKLREKTHQINFNKRQKAAELIVQIQSYQSMPYQLTPLPVIVKFLEDSLENPRDDKELYELSLDIEPRERDDEKIARLLAESGFL